MSRCPKHLVQCLAQNEDQQSEVRGDLHTKQNCVYAQVGTNWEIKNLEGEEKNTSSDEEIVVQWVVARGFAPNWTPCSSHW